MNRKEEFINEFKKYRNSDYLEGEKKINRGGTNFFNESSLSIRKTLLQLANSIKEIENDFTNDTASVLALSSQITEMDRNCFVEDFKSTVEAVENQINELNNKVSSSFRGQYLQYTITILNYLTSLLSCVKMDFQTMLHRRESERRKWRERMLTSIKNTDELNGIIKNTVEIKDENIVVTPKYKQKLLTERDILLQDIFHTNQHLNQADKYIQNISILLKSYNELISEQNVMIENIRENIETSQDNFEVGTAYVKRSTKRSIHFYLSIIIIVLGLMLLF